MPPQAGPVRRRLREKRPIFAAPRAQAVAGRRGVFSLLAQLALHCGVQTQAQAIRHQSAMDLYNAQAGATTLRGQADLDMVSAQAQHRPRKNAFMSVS